MANFSVTRGEDGAQHFVIRVTEELARVDVNVESHLMLARSAEVYARGRVRDEDRFNDIFTRVEPRVVIDVDISNVSGATCAVVLAWVRERKDADVGRVYIHIDAADVVVGVGAIVELLAAQRVHTLDLDMRDGTSEIGEMHAVGAAAAGRVIEQFIWTGVDPSLAFTSRVAAVCERVTLTVVGAVRPCALTEARLLELGTATVRRGQSLTANIVYGSQRVTAVHDGGRAGLFIDIEMGGSPDDGAQNMNELRALAIRHRVNCDVRAAPAHLVRRHAAPPLRVGGRASPGPFSLPAGSSASSPPPLRSAGIAIEAPPWARARHVRPQAALQQRYAAAGIAGNAREARMAQNRAAMRARQNVVDRVRRGGGGGGGGDEALARSIDRDLNLRRGSRRRPVHYAEQPDEEADALRDMEEAIMDENERIARRHALTREESEAVDLMSLQR